MADAQVRAVITAEDRASGVIKNFSSSLQSLGQIAGGIFALDKVIGFGTEFVNAFNAADKATTELNAVLQSTGDVSGVTAKQAEDLATSLSKVTTFSKTTTLAAEDVLLRFTNIGQSIFPQVLKSTQDLATGLGTDLSSAAAILGRALDSPANASRSLRSAQIVLNSTQQETIKNFVEQGKGAQAQAFILDILTTKFGGLSTAVGKTFGGQVQILHNNLELIQEKMGEVIASAIGPFIDSVTRFVANNGQLITSLGIATLVAGGFAAAVIAVAGAVAIAMTVLGPFTIVLLALSALIGVTVFNAMQNFQKKIGDTAKTFSAGSGQIARDGANNFGDAGKAADDLAQKLGDIDEQMQRATRDFQEQMAQMVIDHQQKVTDLKKQMDDETASFTEAQTSQTRSHEQKVRDLESQIKALQITNSKADQQRINDLRVSLAQENESYEQDVKNSSDSHQAKLDDFQTKLNDELAFLKKHGDDIASVQNVQLLDELDKLKRSHAEQMAEFDKQKDRAIASAQQTTSGMAGAFNDLPNQINGGLLNGIGSQLGTNMADALKQSFKDVWNNFWRDVQTGLAPLGQSLIKVGKSGNPFDFFSDLIKGFPHFADGGVVPGPINQPTLAVVHGGETVIPANGSGGTGTININLNAQAFMGTPSEARSFARIIASNLKDVAGAKNMSVAEMLG